MASVISMLSARTRSQATKRPATESPSPALSEPSDSNMVDHGQIADLVWGRLSPRLDSIEKRVSESQQLLIGSQQLLVEKIASLEAANTRKDAQIENLHNLNTALETRLERLEFASRSNNVMLFNVPEEHPGARPIDSVKKILETLPATNFSEMPLSCMRVGKPREGRAAKPRPIQVVFASGEGKHAALRRGKDIRAKGFGIDIDLSPAQQQERQLKHSRFVALKQQNLYPHWRGAKLFYRQDGQVKEDLGPRPPTASPPPSQAPRASAPVAPAGPSYAMVAMP